MIYMPSTLKHLRDSVASLIETCGESSIVGWGVTTFVEGVTLDVVYVSVGAENELQVVGDEANDYVPKPGDMIAVRIQ